VQGLGREVARTVQGQQHGGVEDAVALDNTSTQQGLEHRVKHRSERAGRGLVEERADVVVRGNFMHPEQRLRVVAAGRLLHAALEFQKRRALHEEHRKGARSGILDTVVTILAGTRVRESFKGAA